MVLLKPLSQISCTQLRGVGPQMAMRLEKLGLLTVQDLLFHLPFRYQDRTRIIPLVQLREGDYVMVEGCIIEAQIRQNRRTSLLCCLQDDTGQITLRFFHFTPNQREQFTRLGMRVRCFGEVRWGSNQFEMIHPEYRFVQPGAPLKIDQSLTPVYPTTEGIHQISFRKLTDQALELLNRNNEKSAAQAGTVADYLPSTVSSQFIFPNLVEALWYVHRPPPNAPTAKLEAGLHPAQQRLAFEELLAHQLSLQQLRRSIHVCPAPALSINAPLQAQFLRMLPFFLTQDQQQTAAEIAADLCLTRPMLRLLQGDVGSGKTIVAALAILQTVANGYQAALMAPTELLAEQHYQNFQQWLGPLDITIAFLSSSLKSSLRREVLAQLETGAIQVLIGTHALFQKEVNFARLALVVIDEQHRFGVQQRLELMEKGKQRQIFPHQLIMTATPIPRTLAMTAYSDLDCSVIKQLPPGRKPVTTLLISDSRRQEVIARIDSACHLRQQAYWVCTLIEESEILQCQAAEATFTLLAKALPSLRVALVHGRLKSTEKEQTMAAFKAGNIDLLVATTVIEVGVDVPNASLMVIENAERLGLAQLHQLRGRVGRGQNVSFCVLLHQNPLSVHAKQRLMVLRNSTDGFEIAQKDLEIRGPGEVLGTKQTGLVQFRIADLLRDQHLLPAVQTTSQSVLQNDPQLASLLIDRWVPQGKRYSIV